MINYTIIIPHKNTPDLLAYCLSTIPERDDVQVIVVDDNSDASKVDFENFPKWKGANFECYYTKEGKGAGYARNVGLDHAKGNWVLFVDADDFLLPSINKIFDESNDSVADIIYFRPQAVMLEDRETPSYRADFYNNIIDEYYLTRDETNIRTRFFVPWCKIVRRGLIVKEHIRFDEIKYSNDNLFAAWLGCVAGKIEVKDESFYVVTECEVSLHAGYCTKPGELEIRASAFYRVCKMISQYGYAVDKNVMYDFLNRMLISNRFLYKDYVEKFRELLHLSKIKLIREEFKNNRLVSRMKRTIYALLITL